jgi:hypothetical protein
MAKKSEPSAKIKEFAGLNNMADHRSLSPGELCRADNVDITDRKGIRRRRGHDIDYSPLGVITAAWSSQDESRMFIVDDGSLMEYQGDGGTKVLQTGFPTDTAYFADAGDRYFVSCGGRLGFIGEEGYQDLAIPTPQTPVVMSTPGALGIGRRLVAAVLEAPDGRQGGASAIASVDLETEGLGLQIIVYGEPGYITRIYISDANGDQLKHVGSVDDGVVFISSAWQINGDVLDQAQIDAMPPPTPDGPIAYHEGQLYLSVSDLPGGISYIYKSMPFWPHLFLPWQDTDTVTGQTLMLAATVQGMIVGTNRSIFALSEGGMVELAKYGVVPGQNPYHDTDSQEVYFWSEEGICKGLPFQNMFDGRVSPPPGDYCYIGKVSEGGFDRIVAGTHVADGDNAVASNPSDHYQFRHGQD